MRVAIRMIVAGLALGSTIAAGGAARAENVGPTAASAPTAVPTDDFLARLQRELPGMKGEPLPADTPCRLYRRPMKAARVYRFDDHYFVQQAGTEKWSYGMKWGDRDVECWGVYDSFDALVMAASCPPLPKLPDPLALREVTRLSHAASRLAPDPTNHRLFLLYMNGDVATLDPSTGKTAPVLRGAAYAGENPLTFGMTVDAKGRLYVVINTKDRSVKPYMNRVTVFRTTATRGGLPADPKPWVQAAYPWGINVFNHGVGHITQGPDGMLYVNSGSRTDANEPGRDESESKEGETPLTSCIWRLDPEAAKPEIDVYARGLRNAYAFTWDSKGRMFATDNGPNREPPEELNLIVRGHHYGFPYVFSDHAQKTYDTQPDPPKGLTFDPPIQNVGPDGGGSVAKPLSTFTPHSCPSGLVLLPADWPKPYAGAFLIARFGNYIDIEKDVGYDLLLATLDDSTTPMRISTRTLAGPLGRPLDVEMLDGKAYVLEFCRETDNQHTRLGLPGRVLELAVKK